MSVSLSDDEIETGRIGGRSDPRVRAAKMTLGEGGVPSELRPSRHRQIDPELKNVLGLKDVRRFLDEFWERKPLLVPRRPRAFRDLFSVEIIDHLLATRRLPWHRIRMKDITGKIPGDRSLASYDRVPDLRETSMFMNGGETWWPPLRRLNEVAARSFDRPATCFAFLTPPGGQHLELHWDHYDLFILQLSGKKRWRVYPPLISLPADNQECTDYVFAARRPVLDVELDEGAVLYVPRGFLHQARTGASHAMHLSLALGAVTWHHLFEQSWRRALAGLSDALRRPLSVHDARGRAEALVDRAYASMKRADSAEIAVDESFFPPTRPPLERPTYQPGNILMYRAAARSPKGAAHVTYATLGLRHVARKTKSGTTLVFPDGKVDVPESDARELAYILARPTFSPAGASAGIDAARLARLADRLTDAGFLRRRIVWEPR